MLALAYRLCVKLTTWTESTDMNSNTLAQQQHGPYAEKGRRRGGFSCCLTRPCMSAETHKRPAPPSNHDDNASPLDSPAHKQRRISTENAASPSTAPLNDHGSRHSTPSTPTQDGTHLHESMRKRTPSTNDGWTIDELEKVVAYMKDPQHQVEFFAGTVKKMRTYERLIALFPNKRLNSNIVKKLIKRWWDKYDTLKVVIEAEGFGVTEYDIRNGITTLEEKTRHMSKKYPWYSDLRDIFARWEQPATLREKARSQSDATTKVEPVQKNKSRGSAPLLIGGDWENPPPRGSHHEFSIHDTDAYKNSGLDDLLEAVTEQLNGHSESAIPRLPPPESVQPIAEPSMMAKIDAYIQQKRHHQMLEAEKQMLLSLHTGINPPAHHIENENLKLKKQLMKAELFVKLTAARMQENHAVIATLERAIGSLD